MRIYCDGGGQPRARFAIVADWGPVPLSFVANFPQTPYTSNAMEYEAVFCACVIAREGDEILTDSKLVVKQVAGEWQINLPRFSERAGLIRELLAAKHLTLRWIPREENLAGHLLEEA